MQEWLGNKDILMYSTHNEGKSVIAEKFIRTLKDKIIRIKRIMRIYDGSRYLTLFGFEK